MIFMILDVWRQLWKWRGIGYEEIFNNWIGFYGKETGEMFECFRDNIRKPLWIRHKG